MHPKAVEVLLKSLGPSISRRNVEGWTALHLTSWNNDIGIIKNLTVSRHGVSTYDYEGWHPVHCAASQRSVDAIKALEKVGANLSGGTLWRRGE